MPRNALLDEHATPLPLPPQPTLKRKPSVLFKERLLPQDDASKANQLVFNYIKKGSKLANAPSNAEDTDQKLMSERHAEYRKSLVSLLADSLEGLAQCERQAAMADNHQDDGYNVPETVDIQSPKSDNEDTSDRGSSTSVEDNSSEPKTEPFPDYFESCEIEPPVINNHHEQAYNYAISKVVEEVIRFRDVDARIATLPTFPFETRQHNYMPGVKHLEVINEDEEYTGNANATQQRPCSSNKARDRNEPRSNNNGHDSIAQPTSFIDMRESDKLRVLGNMQSFLEDPEIQESVKSCFHDLTGMIARLEILFGSVGRWPRKSLSTEDYYEIKTILCAVTNYLLLVEFRLEDCLDVGHRVHWILGDVMRDTSVNCFIRYRRISQVIFGNQLRQVTTIESQLLVTFLDLFDTYLYTPYLSITNRIILLQETLDPQRNETTHRLIAMWDILCRVIEYYESYLNLMDRIGDDYLWSSLDEVTDLANGNRGAPWAENLRVQVAHEIERSMEMEVVYSVLRPMDEYFP